MKSSREWWRSAVVYQVYVRSFADGNGDGTGDIAGLRSRLSYLKDLGVDAIWVNPWYVSPFNDGGYDVANYRDIDPKLGTLEEATQFIVEARQLGLRVLVDLVPNHSSSQHPWFHEALRSKPGSPARARYHFCNGRGQGGAEPPSNWKSVFGGPAWTRVADGQWYLHLFDVTQPDLNWSHPQVRHEFREILRFWLDRGVSGFRVDVAHGLVKDSTYPDVDEEREALLAAPAAGNHPFHDRDEVHEIIRDWRRVLREYGDDAILTAEAWVASWQRLGLYLRADEYQQAFNFDFLFTAWNAEAMRRSIVAALEGSAAAGSMPTWVLSNHDVVRHPTRYGLPQDVEAKHWLLNGDRGLLDSDLGLRRARAATLLMLALPGSAYIYQGEELGLPEVYDLPIDVLDDPVWTRSNHREKGRDGCRVPIPWNSTGPSCGFGSDGSWLPQPPGWGELSEEAQKGMPGSTLEMYRSALRLRREHCGHELSLEWLPGFDESVVAFAREGGLRCLVNFGSHAIDLPEGAVLVASGPTPEKTIPPNTAVWLGRSAH